MRQDYQDVGIPPYFEITAKQIGEEKKARVIQPLPKVTVGQIVLSYGFSLLFLVFVFALFVAFSPGQQKRIDSWRLKVEPKLTAMVAVWK